MSTTRRTTTGRKRRRSSKSTNSHFRRHQESESKRNMEKGTRQGRQVAPVTGAGNPSARSQGAPSLPFLGFAVLLEVAAAAIGLAACNATSRLRWNGSYHNATTGLYVLSLAVAILLRDRPTRLDCLFSHSSWSHSCWALSRRPFRQCYSRSKRSIPRCLCI